MLHKTWLDSPWSDWDWDWDYFLNSIDDTWFIQDFHDSIATFGSILNSDGI